MAQRLKKFRVRKVSLVGWGANNEPLVDPTVKKSAPHNEILIFKSGDSMFDIKKEDPPVEEKKEDEETKEEEKKEEAEKSFRVRKEDDEEKKDDEEEKKEEAEKSFKLKKEDGEEEKKDEEEKEETEKSADALVREVKELRKSFKTVVKSLRQENVELRKALDGEVTRRAIQDCIQKAADNLPSLGRPEAIGRLIYNIEKSNLSQTDKKAIESLLVKAESLSQASAPLFKSMGFSKSDSDTSAAAEINRRAQDMITKSAKPIDLATARAEIRKQYPDLARREQKEAV